MPNQNSTQSWYYHNKVHRPTVMQVSGGPLGSIPQVYIYEFYAALRNECMRCGEIKDDVELQLQNTAYVDIEKNWITVCSECAAEIDELWRSAWDDYNSSRF